MVAWAVSLKITSLSLAADVTFPWLLINRLAMVSTGWKMASSAIPADPEDGQSLWIGGDGVEVPDPKSLAVADSFLNSFAAELATASTTCGAIRPLVSACAL